MMSLRILSNLAVCVGLLVTSAPAFAQGHPQMQPTRDVTVTYSGVTGAPVHMSWLVAEHLMRTDIAPGIWGVHNEASNTTEMVNDAQHVVMSMPMMMDPTQIGAQPGARFTRAGSNTVAGLECTLWDIQVAGGDAKACVTADGVLLHLDAMGITLDATDVTYAAQDPARFHVPADYTKQAP